MYLATKIYYHAQVLPLPGKYLRELERQVRRFLFRGRIVMGKLKLQELSQPDLRGAVVGLGTEVCLSTFVKFSECLRERSLGGCS